jgi:hypothetical protein
MDALPKLVSVMAIDYNAGCELVEKNEKHTPKSFQGVLREANQP